MSTRVFLRKDSWSSPAGQLIEPGGQRQQQKFCGLCGKMCVTQSLPTPNLDVRKDSLVFVPKAQVLLSQVSIVFSSNWLGWLSRRHLPFQELPGKDTHLNYPRRNSLYNNGISAECLLDRGTNWEGRSFSPFTLKSDSFQSCFQTPSEHGLCAGFPLPLSSVHLWLTSPSFSSRCCPGYFQNSDFTGGKMRSKEGGGGRGRGARGKEDSCFLMMHFGNNKETA